MREVVELLAYAAAMDLYKRHNLTYGHDPLLSGREIKAMLIVVDWQNRPILAR